MKSTFMHQDQYDRLIDKLFTADLSDPATGNRHPDALKIALGEYGDIWPEAIRADSERHGQTGQDLATLGLPCLAGRSPSLPAIHSTKTLPNPTPATGEHHGE